jgi:hypothetical protein
VLWAASISVFSTDLFSSQKTSRYLIPFLQWLLPHASWQTIFLLYDGIRKAAHLGEYFILSALVFRGMRGEARGWKLSWSMWTVALVVAYSALDEVHQAFVPSRTGSAVDVLIDALGAIAAQVLLCAYYRRKNAEGEEARAPSAREGWTA